jgi:aminopeptidase YwaD
LIVRLLLSFLTASLLLSSCIGVRSEVVPPTAAPTAVSVEAATPTRGIAPSPQVELTREPVQSPTRGAGQTPSAAPPTLTVEAPTQPPPTEAPTATPEAESAPVEAPTVVVAAEPATFSGELARQSVQALAGQIGSRPAGSEAQARATKFLRGSLEALGYETRVQEFPVVTYVDRGSSLRLTVGSTQEFGANPVAFSPAGIVEAELVDGGLGYPEELAGASGKLALIRRGDLRFAEKVANAAAAGAVGVILYNDSPGNIFASLFTEGALPAVMLSGDEGESLRSLVATDPLRAELRVAGGTESRLGRNVIAHREGTSGRTVVVGAHYDSVPAGPGANDNASGTAVMLEVARVLATQNYPHSVDLIAFDAEELGLLGSAYYVEQLPDEQRESLLAMVNLDMLSVGDVLQFAGSDALVAQAMRISEQNGWPAERLEGSLRGASDHANFVRIGVEAVFIYRSNDPRYHSSQDTVENVTAENLQAAGTIALGLLDLLAGR